MYREHFLPTLFTDAEPADIINSTDAGTYIGKYDRGKFDPSKPAEEQPIWSIRFIATPSEAITQTLYPEGSKQSNGLKEIRITINTHYNYGIHTNRWLNESIHADCWRGTNYAKYSQ